MIEQWFLDLDGVRSGPYQTPEVMSLIAEGEVLPHHRISTSLREQRWETILDWRLEQAKISQNPRPSPFSTSRSEVSSVEGLEEERSPLAPAYVPPPAPAAPQNISPPQASAPEISAQQFTVETPTHAEPEAPVPPRAPEPPASAKYAHPAPRAEIPAHTSENANTPLEAPEEPSEEVENVSTKSSSPFEQPYTPPVSPYKAPVETTEGEEPPPAGKRPKRDPMAEMFDMLQNTKQKREAKQSRADASGILMEHDDPNAPKSSGGGLGRTLMIGGGITLIGFALGQIFQQSAPPKEPVGAQAKATPFVTSTSATPAHAHTEVVDRSNEKMTIRATVDHGAEHKPAEGAAAAGSPAAVNKINTGHTLHTAQENPQNEKEIEELRNLKKELQELKALKNNPSDEDMNMEAPDAEGLDAKDPGMDPTYNEPATGTYPKGGYPQGYPPGYPQEGGAQQPSNNGQ